MSSRPLVDPDLLDALEAMPAPRIVAGTLASVRAGDRDLAAQESRIPADPGVRVDSYYVPGRDGAPEVRLLLCRPTGEPSATGSFALLWIHGGGYVCGSADLELPQMSSIVSDLAGELDLVVAVVDYRLAPESPFPAPLDDCYAALEWLHANAVDLGIDPARLVVAGESAGGGLAAATCQLARDRGGVPVAYQLLVYPMLDDRTVTREGHPFAGEFIWTPQSNRFGWESYLGSPAGAATAPPYAAPARTADLVGLPPAFVCVGALDLFVDEDIDYARRLIEAGVPTELHVYPGAYHGFPPGTGVSATYRRDIRSALSRALRTAVAGSH